MKERDFIRFWSAVIAFATLITAYLLIKEWNASKSTYGLVFRAFQMAFYSFAMAVIIFKSRYFVRFKFYFMLIAGLITTASMAVLQVQHNDFYFVWGVLQVMTFIVFFGELRSKQVLAITIACFALHIAAIIYFSQSFRSVISLAVFGSMMLAGHRLWEKRRDADQQTLSNLKGFIAQARHDLQQPIAALNRWLFNLGKTANDPKKLKTCLTNVREILSHMHFIISEVLELARSNKEVLTITSWGDVRMDKIAESIERFTNEAPEIENETGKPLNQLVFKGDFDPALRALLNLVFNARKYSVDEAYNIKLHSHDNKLRITIANEIKEPDTIPEDPFSRSKETLKLGASSGIGLSIVKDTMSALNGACGYSLDGRTIAFWLEFQLV